MTESPKTFDQLIDPFLRECARAAEIWAASTRPSSRTTEPEFDEDEASESLDLEYQLKAEQRKNEELQSELEDARRELRKVVHTLHRAYGAAELLNEALKGPFE